MRRGNEKTKTVVAIVLTALLSIAVAIGAITQQTADTVEDASTAASECLEQSHPIDCINRIVYLGEISAQAGREALETLKQ